MAMPRWIQDISAFFKKAFSYFKGKKEATLSTPHVMEAAEAASSVTQNTASTLEQATDTIPMSKSAHSAHAALSPDVHQGFSMIVAELNTFLHEYQSKLTDTLYPFLYEKKYPPRKPQERKQEREVLRQALKNIFSTYREKFNVSIQNARKSLSLISNEDVPLSPDSALEAYGTAFMSQAELLTESLYDCWYYEERVTDLQAKVTKQINAIASLPEGREKKAARGQLDALRKTWSEYLIEFRNASDLLEVAEKKADMSLAEVEKILSEPQHPLSGLSKSPEEPEPIHSLQKEALAFYVFHRCPSKNSKISLLPNRIYIEPLKDNQNNQTLHYVIKTKEGRLNKGIITIADFPSGHEEAFKDLWELVNKVNPNASISKSITQQQNAAVLFHTGKQGHTPYKPHTLLRMKQDVIAWCTQRIDKALLIDWTQADILSSYEIKGAPKEKQNIPQNPSSDKQCIYVESSGKNTLAYHFMDKKGDMISGTISKDSADKTAAKSFKAVEKLAKKAKPLDELKFKNYPGLKSSLLQRIDGKKELSNAFHGYGEHPSLPKKETKTLSGLFKQKIKQFIHILSSRFQLDAKMTDFPSEITTAKEKEAPRVLIREEENEDDSPSTVLNEKREKSDEANQAHNELASPLGQVSPKIDSFNTRPEPNKDNSNNRSDGFSSLPLNVNFSPFPPNSGNKNSYPALDENTLARNDSFLEGDPSFFFLNNQFPVDFLPAIQYISEEQRQLSMMMEKSDNPPLLAIVMIQYFTNNIVAGTLALQEQQEGLFSAINELASKQSSLRTKLDETTTKLDETTTKLDDVIEELAGTTTKLNDLAEQFALLMKQQQEEQQQKEAKAKAKAEANQSKGVFEQIPPISDDEKRGGTSPRLFSS